LTIAEVSLVIAPARTIVIEKEIVATLDSKVEVWVATKSTVVAALV
jgi:hypothetical protein